MTRIYANTQAVQSRFGRFFPRGEMVVIGNKAHLLENPVLEEYEETLAGRLIVGLDRLGQKPATVDQLIAIVRRVRTEQVGDPSSSFLLQKGLYQHKVSGEVVEEQGAQVIIIDTTGATQADFRKQMVALAETLAIELSQESVIVEIQLNGVTQRTLSVGP